MSSTKYFHTKSQVDDLQFSKNGKLAVATSSLNTTFWDGEIFILQQQANKLEAIWKASTLGGCNCICWLGAQEDTFVTGSDSGAIQIWSTKDDKPLRNLFEHDDIVTSLSINNLDQQNTILSASWDFSIKLWPADNDRASQTFLEHFNFVWDVAWNHKTTNLFASAAQDGCLKMWDCRQADSTSTIKSGVPLFSVSWNPFNEHVIAVGQFNGAKIFDTRNSSEPIQFYKVHTANVKKVRFSPFDEKKLAASSDNNTVCVINTGTNNVESTFKGHNNFVRGLSWSLQQENLLASGGWDRKVALWNCKEVRQNSIFVGQQIY